jgi:hypothetical protein
MFRRCNSRRSLLLILLTTVWDQGLAWTSSRPIAPRLAVTNNAPLTSRGASPWTHGRIKKLFVHVDLDSIGQAQEFEFQQHHKQRLMQLEPMTPAAETTTTTIVSSTDDDLKLTDIKIDANVQTVLNGLLLAVCFGYAAYTILNIDHGMTRGWTQSEIVLRVPLDNWNNYETALQEKPIFTKTLINVVIYLLGDWLAQTLFQGKNALEFDAMR